MYHRNAMGFYGPFKMGYDHPGLTSPRVGPDAEVVVGLATANGDACYKSDAQGAAACVLTPQGIEAVHTHGRNAGIAVGAALGLVVVGGLAFMFKRRK